MSLRNKCTLQSVHTAGDDVRGASLRPRRPKGTLPTSDSAKEPPAYPAANHPNPLLQSAVSYEPPPPHHFIRRPRNVLSDPPDELTAEVERLISINKDMAEGYGQQSTNMMLPTHAGAWQLIRKSCQFECSGRRRNPKKRGSSPPQRVKHV
ncbi:hypothetical protein EVAR_3264_1 [Eumeta japonica]|uniref:Uncharacterized protein n=1 Tax=Eumeta variegata TaxID=151549 RepID=A0A4C1SXM1_EUMVA|nr:hypothetical protein EVAR_3264_1 [Eumeta japonica]